MSRIARGSAIPIGATARGSSGSGNGRIGRTSGIATSRAGRIGLSEGSSVMGSSLGSIVAAVRAILRQDDPKEAVRQGRGRSVIDGGGQRNLDPEAPLTDLEGVVDGLGIGLTGALPLDHECIGKELDLEVVLANAGQLDGHDDGVWRFAHVGGRSPTGRGEQARWLGPD